MRLEGKVAIITGASRGIGFSIAKAFVREGAKVMICDIKQEYTDEAVKNLLCEYPEAEAAGFGFNVSDTEGVKAVIAKTLSKWGRIDVLVNNAGVSLTKSMLEMTDDDLAFVMNVNLVGPFKMIREVAAIMKENGGGSIINTSSMVGNFGSPMQTAYASSKFALNGLTKSCAREFGRYGIRVNAVAPGAVDTEMSKQGLTEKGRENVTRCCSLRRMADPDEIAGAYVYLASDESTFTTGAILNIDGGIVM